WAQMITPNLCPRKPAAPYRAVQAASPNHPPTVKILTPNYGDQETYPSVTFKARVTDPENPSPMGVGADFSTRVVFSSDRDGHLCSVSGDATALGGVDLSCEALDLSLGGHLIKVTATDPFGAVATESVNFNVINTPPTVKITHPADGATYDTSQQVNLRGYAFDVDEEDDGYLPLSWSSDLSGSLGTAADFWVSLPEGDHTITLAATDEKGETATDTITVHVQEPSPGGGTPTAQITQPADNLTFPPDAVITFQGQATDPEDGTITTDAAFLWSSSLDGILGTGRTLERTLSLSGEASLHEITLAVTDSDGHQGMHTIPVTVLRPQ
ncbi:MAG: hypothetical protein P1P84_21335, partial [Deferrisomatales bacterium]|nr:hypothetical protein [Deferrisomatales bacterium]